MGTVGSVEKNKQNNTLARIFNYSISMCIFLPDIFPVMNISITMIFSQHLILCIVFNIIKHNILCIMITHIPLYQSNIKYIFIIINGNDTQLEFFYKLYFFIVFTRLIFNMKLYNLHNLSEFFIKGSFFLW